MKKLTALFAVCLFALAAKAQYDENFTFWKTVMYPDNHNAKMIKKGGYKTLSVVSYEPDAVDTAETIMQEGYYKYDTEGRLAWSGLEANSLSYAEYTYDKKGNVLKYGTQSAFWIGFEYDKKKLKAIKHHDSNHYRWDAAKKLLIGTKDGDTIYHYFNKDGMPEKYVHVYRPAGAAPNFYYTDSTFYTYDKKGTLTGYLYRQTNIFGDTTERATGTYTYNKKNVLTRAVIKKYNSESGLTDEKTGAPMPEVEEEYGYAVAQKSGRVVNYTYTRKKNYRYGGEVNTDTNEVEEGYIYNPEGLLIITSQSLNPGVVSRYVYTYGK